MVVALVSMILLLMLSLMLLLLLLMLVCNCDCGSLLVMLGVMCGRSVLMASAESAHRHATTVCVQQFPSSLVC